MLLNIQIVCRYLFNRSHLIIILPFFQLFITIMARFYKKYFDIVPYNTCIIIFQIYISNLTKILMMDYDCFVKSALITLFAFKNTIVFVS